MTLTPVLGFGLSTLSFGGFLSLISLGGLGFTSLGAGFGFGSLTGFISFTGFEGFIVAAFLTGAFGGADISKSALATKYLSLSL